VRTTAGDVRVPHARLLVAAAALVICAAILWPVRNYTFYFDEWDFILQAPTWTAVTYLQPHNEHPAMLPRLIYAALLDTAGLRTYVPYMAVLLVLHGANAVLVFEVVRRRAGELIGLACALLLLVLGAGWEDLLWAFQLSFLGSVTAGLGALLLLELPAGRKRLVAAVLAVTGSMMFSGIGLFFAVAAAIRLVLDPGRRRDVLWLVPTGAAFALWFVVFGRTGAATVPPPSASNLFVLPAYIAWGVASSAGGLVGLGGWQAWAVLALVLAALGLAWWRRGPDPLAIGLAAGLLTFYAVTGAVRAQLGYAQAGAGRYAYVGAVFWLILLADAARLLPWRGTWRPALAACLFLACFSSATLLFTWFEAKSVLMDREVADLNALAAERHDPCLNPNGAADRLVMPQVTDPALYYRVVDRYGDPAAGRATTDRTAFDAAVRNLRKPGC
jgi:hypothetical protein